jgi:glutamate-1-semialdehyde 2,1-aminomutase
MESLAPLGDVYQAGTLSGNPLATAAGLAALAQLDEGAYAALDDTARQLADGLASAIASAGLPVTVPRVGPLVGLFFTDEPVRDYDDARAANGDHRYRRFFHAMLRRGIALAPGAYELLFPSLAHDATDLRVTLEAAGAAAVEVAAAEAAA